MEVEEVWGHPLTDHKEAGEREREAARIICVVQVTLQVDAETAEVVVVETAAEPAVWADVEEAGAEVTLVTEVVGDHQTPGEALEAAGEDLVTNLHLFPPAK